MDIPLMVDMPAGLWDRFDRFIAENRDCYYTVLEVGVKDGLTAIDDRITIYSCVVNNELWSDGKSRGPHVTVKARGKHAYYDIDTRQPGEIYTTYVDDYVNAMAAEKSWET